MKTGNDLGLGQPEKSKKNSFMYVTHCIPIVDSRITIPYFVLTFSSLTEFDFFYPTIFSTAFLLIVDVALFFKF